MVITIVIIVIQFNIIIVINIMIIIICRMIFGTTVMIIASGSWSTIIVIIFN